MKATSRDSLDFRRQARAWFRTWARGIAREGKPRPQNVVVLRAGAILDAPQPGALLDALVEVARQDAGLLEEVAE